MNTKLFFSLSFVLILFSCSKSEENPAPLAPASANLIFPLNNTECNEGEVLDVNSSVINFQWEAAENTTIYEVYIEDFNSIVLYQEQTSEIELKVTLARGKAFKWYVESKSDNISEIAKSEVWSFYNAGEGETTHVPFPAELMSPSEGKSYTSGTTKVNLEWSGNDLDNDILEYKIYLGVNNPPTNLEGIVSEENIEINTNSGLTYYWFIQSVDSNNNSSNSAISHFIID